MNPRKEALATLAACVSLSVAACAPHERDHDPNAGSLQFVSDETSIDGTFEHDGMIVGFQAGSQDQRASLELDIGGLPVSITLDTWKEFLTEDAHGSRFDFAHRAALVALRDAVTAQVPELLDTFHGKLLVNAADRFGEMPIGRALTRREVAYAPHAINYEAVIGGCGGDGVTCLPGTSGSSWAIFFASGICDARSTAYGDSVCRGRCGAGCSWWDEDYTWDCLDHDVCLDYSSDCDDEFNEAADDWAATFAPLCWSGTSRSKPPSVPKCGDGSIAPGEQCDDGNIVPGDGCNEACAIETTHIVINEVDYDQNLTDAAEFIEIYNPNAVPVELANLALVFVNGADLKEYRRIPLSGTLPANGYLVVCAQGATPGTCAAGVTVPSGTMIINFPTATNNVQNGATDGVALVDLSSGKLVDVLSYEGTLTAGVINEVGTFSFVEGNATLAADDGDFASALVRLPNGKDTDDALTDWGKRPPSPGAANPQ
jgi:cysteine-rich repeat protein